MIERLDHAALSVSDLDRSIAFYREHLGFSLTRIVESPPEMRLGDVVGLPGASARIAHLECGSTMIELLQYLDPVGRPVAPGRTQADHGVSHICFRSTDTRVDADRLRRAGVIFLGGPLEYRPGVWIAYFRGPDGEVCELRQVP